MIWRVAFLVLVMAGTAWAVEPDEILDDPALEERARNISAEVRCVVCQNEAIDSSNAAIARDLRILIRERLMAGDTDQEVFDLLVSRYGEFVLFKPPFSSATALLWIAPAVFLGFGTIGIFAALRRPKSIAAPDLTEEEEREIHELMQDRDL